ALLNASPEMIPPDAADLVGRTAPEVRLQLTDGTQVALAHYRGKPVVLSFWASWCGPCRRELPALSEFSQHHKDVMFLAVNVDRDRNAAERFLKEVAVNLPLAFDSDSSAMGRFDVVSMPTLFVLDKNGTVKLRKVGFSPEKGFAELTAALDG